MTNRNVHPEPSKLDQKRDVDRRELGVKGMELRIRKERLRSSLFVAHLFNEQA